MKRTLLLIAFALILGGRMMAQEGARVGFRASPMVNWATTVVDSTKLKPTGYDNVAKMGFSFDFIFTYGFSENIGLFTGINIATKAFGTDVPAVNFTSKTSFTSLEVPLGLKFRSPEIGDGIYVAGFFGIRPELNVQNKVVSTLGSISTEARDVDGIRFFTTSFTPALGVNKEFDWGMLEGTVTYHWGLLDYFGNENGYQYFNTKMNGLSLNLGYYF